MAPPPHTRERIGAAIRAERQSRSLSIESAAKAGGVGHMTWRKIEQGGSVHDQSYYAVDRTFGWQAGHTLATVNNDGTLTPAPPPAPTGSVVAQTPPEPDYGRDPLTNTPLFSFETVIQAVESLSLYELRTLNKLTSREIEIREKYSESALQAIEALHKSSFTYQAKYVTETSPEVGQRYNKAAAEYMQAWQTMQHYAYDLRNMAEGDCFDLTELRKHYLIFIEANGRLMEIFQRLVKIEKEAAEELGEHLTQEETE